MDISVVIPTCNRKKNLLSLLQNLNNSFHKVLEIIIVDSGEDKLEASDLEVFGDLNITYIRSEKSVCIQRNIGIAKAKASWIFLCDDDVEVPVDYLQKLKNHITKTPKAHVVSGLFLQKETNEWQAKYSVTSSFATVWYFIFQLSIWGELNCKNNLITRRIKRYYQRKGNHISKAGWPVITDFSGNYFITPVYSLGASLVQKQWLINSSFDEVLDPHGIGDNYGVAIGFPAGIHILNDAFVYHHYSQANRLQKSLQYYRRVLALDYFRKTKHNLQHIKKGWFLWSLLGNLLLFGFTKNGVMMKATLKSLRNVVFNKNPYYWGALHEKKIIKPIL
jgi:glycosyltransferase involved in cell wall biosynthesis